nr:transposon TX1 [Tanacetum cinerariifolium]
MGSMWMLLKKFGTVFDMYMVQKRLRNGERYGYVQFKLVTNVEELLKRLREIKFGEENLKVFVAYDRKNLGVRGDEVNGSVGNEMRKENGCDVQEIENEAKTKIFGIDSIKFAHFLSQDEIQKKPRAHHWIELEKTESNGRSRVQSSIRRSEREKMHYVREKTWASNHLVRKSDVRHKRHIGNRWEYNGKRLGTNYTGGKRNSTVSFMFFKFPTDWGMGSMWMLLKKFGTVFDMYMVQKRLRNGERYGYVQFKLVTRSLRQKELKKKSSGSTTSHYDFSLFEFESFHFDLLIDQFPPADRSDLYHEEFADELAHIISLPEYDRFYFDFEDDPVE